MRKATLLAAAVLMGTTGIAHAQQQPPSVLRLLPTKVQKDIEETRASCREYMDKVGDKDTYEDAGLTHFTLPGGADGIMVNDGDVCWGEQIKGGNCHTGGCDVNVYVR
jgi:hypothetical protein